MLGQALEVAITEVDPANRKMLVSERLGQQLRATRMLTPGNIIKGQVMSVSAVLVPSCNTCCCMGHSVLVAMVRVKQP